MQIGFWLVTDGCQNVGKQLPVFGYEQNAGHSFDDAANRPVLLALACDSSSVQQAQVTLDTVHGLAVGS